MVRIRSALSLLVILIMLFMTVVVAVFIYSSFNLKNRVTLQTVQKTEQIAEIITHSTIWSMGTGHEGNKYSRVLSYDNVIGVEDLGIFTHNGFEAFVDRGPEAETERSRRIEDEEIESFVKAATTGHTAGFFSWDNKSYSHFVPLWADGACTSCHTDNGRPLGVLKIKLSTYNDFALLDYLKKLIWTLGVMAFLPVIALLVAGSIIKEKNRIYADLKKSNADLTDTYSKLDETSYYLQMILDNSRVIIVTTDTSGRVVEFNKEAENLLEYTKEDVVGQDILSLYDDTVDRSQFLNKSRAMDGEVWEVRNREVTLKSKSGKRYHVIITLSTMVDKDGKIIGTVGVGKDISEQKMLQFKLLQSEKLAGIGTLASGIAHEINNPLAGILGMAEAIRDEEDMELIKSYTNDIIQYAVNASNIVRELSAYSRSARSEARSTVNMSDVIEDSLKMARHASPFMSIDINTALSDRCFVIVNSGEMQQVFVNLIINAIHAMGDEGTLTLRCAREGGFVVASVTDTGGGISDEHISQIYDPFFTTKPVGKGTGLGLYVVYRIVTKYGGSIDVETNSGGGTTFRLKFPSDYAEKAV